MYFKQIDSFRFFSVFLVLFSHWANGLPYIENLRLGSIGVDFFLVISGFLISTQLYYYKKAIDEKQEKFGKALYVFYLRRFLRIFPLYYFVVIVASAVNRGEIRDAIFWNLGYASNFYFIKYQHWTSIFSHFWSLSVEEHFYLFWPFIVLIIKRKYLPLVFIFVSLFSILFRYSTFIENHDYFVVYVHTLSCLDLFMLGGFLSYLYEYNKELFNRIFTKILYRYLTLFSFVILYGILILRPDWVNFNWIFQRFLLGVVYTATIGFLVIGVKGIIGRFFELKLLVHLGKLSYGIYLIHNFVPGMLLPIKKLELPFFVEFIVYLTVTLIGSEILYRIIEKPIRNLNKYFKLKIDTVRLNDIQTN